MKRIEFLGRLAFEKRGFDGFLITNEANILYFAGFSGAACLLFLKTGEKMLYVYGVNYEQARAEGKAFNVELVKGEENLMAKVGAKVKDSGVKKLAFDTLTLSDYRRLARELRGKARITLQDRLVWMLRRVKDAEEQAFMRKAGELTCEGMKAAYEFIRPGVREIEAAAEIEYSMRRKGSWGTAFETIVASGPRSAFPHGGCSEREIREGELVVVDIGASYRHYRSDMTRTFTAGKALDKQKKIYEVVRMAQEEAFKSIRPGVKAKEVDAAARRIIDESGYGEHFVHGLGHGVGLEIHEPPTLSMQSKDRLTAGNVLTVEPGIYLLGFGGIRIEDTIKVQKKGVEKLTSGWYTLEIVR